MNQGYVKMWRKSKDSSVFAHEGLWKLFCLCLMKACHKETEVTIPGILQPIKLKPGQFVTGRESLWEEYHQLHLKKKPRRKPAPHAITLFRWLLTLQDMSILHIKTYNKYSIITIFNWNRYQQDEQQMHISCTSNVHKQECIKNVKETPEKISLEVSALRNRYPDQDLLDQVFKAIASTRKSNRVSDSILLTQLQKWDRYPVEQVLSGIRIYLDKGYAEQGKDEKYLLGIIRNQKSVEQKPISTGSALLDSYYARNPS
ncbi:MAG: hypothetical protein JRH18_19960 [Deltaproteobacteria bacterium]|nr:hypothetical protein [Deltaproteobacteria bacterium]MBW2153927.1 hypothetical protein [Deltaproteobacteria bacterium]